MTDYAERNRVRALLDSAELPPEGGGLAVPAGQQGAGALLVAVPVTTLRAIIGIVHDLVLDGEDADNELACAVAHDVVRLNDCLPDGTRWEHMRDHLSDLLAAKEA